MQEFSISEVTQITGLTRTTVLYYESKNLIHPRLEGNAGYRKYSIDDISQIMFYRRLKPLGISVDEYAATVNKHSTIHNHDVYELILMKKTAYMKRMSFYITMWEETLTFTHLIRNKGIYYQIQDSRDAWSFIIDQKNTPTQQNILKNWDQYFLQRNLSYFFDRKELQNGNLNFSRGLSCYADCALLLNRELREKLTYIPSCRCLLIALPMKLKEEDFNPIFKKALNLLKQMHMEICDDPWGNIGYRNECSDETNDYFFLWIPVTESGCS
ncbi:MerR family transcriptional regulator [Lacrimispora sp. 38-1]|uniref:MerR family transcriptional regulator n=1 Tax=Lacrimispora sp. 38-1 TaxID=3125778 RepID=UPI003CEDC0EA